MLATQVLSEVASRARYEHDELTNELALTSMKLNLEMDTNRSLMRGSEHTVAMLESLAARNNITGQEHMQHVEEHGPAYPTITSDGYYKHGTHRSAKVRRRRLHADVKQHVSKP